MLSMEQKWKINKGDELDEYGNIRCDLPHPHDGKHRYVVVGG